MKTKNLLLMIVIAAITLTSCGKDDDNNVDNDVAEMQNATEETVIPSIILEEGIIIDGASKESGTPPSPNSDMSFELNTDLTEAFQSSGLKIQFSSEEEVAGAYIQFKDTEGNATDSYFDIPSSSFNNVYSKNANSTKKKGFLKTSAKLLEDEFDNEIEIDFAATIPAGEFCYDICLYDEENNVFQIQTVCATVEAWGGNDSIVGEWVLDRFEDSFEDYELNCDSGETISVETYRSIKNEVDFTINQDGTFYVLQDSEEENLDFDASEESCTAIYSTTDTYLYNEKTSGNWAFNENNETLTAVAFKIEDFIDPDDSEEIEDGESLFEGYIVEIISGQLVLTDTEDDLKIYFDRK